MVWLMPKPMPTGTRAEVEQRVQFQHTLAHFEPQLPAVLATPQMIGWMEWACMEAAVPYCEPDEVTVGVAIHVEHLAATGVGQLVKAEATVHCAASKTIHAEAQAADLYAAIDALADKLDRQVKKHKEKLTDHHREDAQRLA